ncbi:MAG: PilN domain-containing protein [Deltaproteobacteria bacterium]|nr:PilN domain-containing protein [Deltaproteobacteria bacterium]
MIRINLLPFRAAKKLENIRMQISVYVLSVVLLVAVLSFSLIMLNSKIKELQAQESRLQKELDSYAEMLKKIKELKRKRADVKGKLDVIQGLEAQKAGPVQLFDEIAMAVPEGKLFLRSINESKDTVSMSGVAIDYDTVARFMTNLENTTKINTVTLGSTNQTEQNKLSVCNFTLSCTKQAGKK